MESYNLFIQVGGLPFSYGNHVSQPVYGPRVLLKARRDRTEERQNHGRHLHTSLCCQVDEWVEDHSKGDKYPTEREVSGVDSLQRVGDGATDPHHQQ